LEHYHHTSNHLIPWSVRSQTNSEIKTRPQPKTARAPKLLRRARLVTAHDGVTSLPLADAINWHTR